jgi:glycosyltransferase involved in cell wall biosynthesis
MNIGGPAHHVSLLSGGLADRYDTLLLTGALGAGEGSLESLAREHGARVRTVPGLRPEISPGEDLRALANLVRIVRRFEPDIVHSHTAKAGTLGRLAAALTPGTRPLIVHTYHGHVLTGYFGPVRNLVFRAIERGLARITDVLIGVSSATVRELVDLRVAPSGKFRTIPIGLELDELLNADRSAGSAFRLEVGVGAETVLAVFVGRLAPIKRVDVLINAFAIAAAQERDLVLAVVGDGETRLALEEQVQGAGLEQRVRFLGFRHDLVAINAGADIAVLSSDNEGTPVALIEASAAARPSIATDVGGVSDIVRDDCGIRVTAGDVQAFADALVLLARDPLRREQMGVAAREHVRMRCAAERLIHDIDELYRELLASRTTGASPTRGEDPR